jgi:oligopeptide transport system substrate-binding protein
MTKANPKKTLMLILAIVSVFAVGFGVFMSSGKALADEITDLQTWETQARELETWNIHYSQAAADLNVLTNLIDGLLTNDNHGNLKPNAAKSYSSEDGGKTWTFVLNDGMTWFDKDGNVKANVVAQDWKTGLEWILNYAKNDSYNVSMPNEMIKGAQEYYEYTKTLTESEGADAAKALTVDGKFSELVGIETPDDKTIVYTLVDQLPYFPSVATYNCLYPLSQAMIDEMGVDGYRDVTWENMWYSGPYTVTYFVNQNEKVLTKSKNYWNDANCKRFDTVTVKMVESIATGYQLFTQGELDHISLDQATTQEIYNDPSNEFNPYLVEARPTKYSYQMHLVYNKNKEDGTPDVNWNTAIANENFRKSLYYGLDLTAYFARTNAINPQSCQNYCYTGNGVAFTSDGKDYTSLVLKEIGLEYDSTKYTRFDMDKAQEYKAKAMEELSAKGVTFPVEIDYYIAGNSTTAADTAKVLEAIFDQLGDDYVKLNTKTYISSLANEVRKPHLASFFINGWGADFADPINFLGQETYNDTAAFYSNNYSYINEATDADLIADYEEFTKLVNEAKAITTDLDARYAAFAKAEACFIDHVLAIPCNYEVSWELTGVNNYSKVYSMYGMQGYRYVDWETDKNLYTTDAMKAAAEAYAAE